MSFVGLVDSVDSARNRVLCSCFNWDVKREGNPCFQQVKLQSSDKLILWRQRWSLVSEKWWLYFLQISLKLWILYYVFCTKKWLKIVFVGRHWFSVTGEFSLTHPHCSLFFLLVVCTLNACNTPRFYNIVQPPRYLHSTIYWRPVICHSFCVYYRRGLQDVSKHLQIANIYEFYMLSTIIHRYPVG